ncbi:MULTISPECIES: hypothetical protein [unclassified Microbacterium]|uniref:hypothetical protein n=1 Tax=unclassified Microbacterium TaxID=2609290 RepID=UPI00386FC1AD
MILEYQAVKARGEEAPSLEGVISDVVRVNDAGGAVRDNYVVLTMSVPAEETDRWTAVTRPDHDREVVFGTQAVAVDPTGVMLFVEDLKAQYLGHVLTVDGRRCDPIRRLPDVEEGEIKHDRTSGLFYAHMSWAFISRRSD